MKIPLQQFGTGNHQFGNGKASMMAYQEAATPAPQLSLVQQQPQAPNYGDYMFPGTGIVLPIPSKNHNNYANIVIDPSMMTPFNGDTVGTPASIPPYPSGENGEITSSSGGLNVRAEEVGLVLLVLLLWAGAVALFFNRWGKIRMLEPYQPKFIDAPRGSLANAAPPLVITGGHRPSYPVIEIAHQQPRLHPHHSRLNVSSAGACCSCGEDHQQMSSCAAAAAAAVSASGRRRPTSPSLLLLPHHHHHSAYRQAAGHRLSPGLPSYGMDAYGYQRPRQNSVVVFATAHFMTAARRVKSAMDLQTLVLREETEESVHALSGAGPGGGSANNVNAASGSSSAIGPVPTCNLSEAAITCV